MSNKVKGIVAAVLALLVTVFGWYVAYSDNDEATKPDTQAVIEAGKDVVDAVTATDKDLDVIDSGEAE